MQSIQNRYRSNFHFREKFSHISHPPPTPKIINLSCQRLG
ncbi:hypothetical protein CWATWH0003_5636 [Crocosphaera watsonii WH 0003]|uniref:Uncharacterized protein n=1 Tax=Crocosphaera watsonii WH 0003 TaxID=423471 RepID=G5JDZ7_CROWT|nr:hypothetical protein CWATWH0003_5636 [Crocosphaera watsonii WH 0003]